MNDKQTNKKRSVISEIIIYHQTAKGTSADNMQYHTTNKFAYCLGPWQPTFAFQMHATARNKNNNLILNHSFYKILSKKIDAATLQQFLHSYPTQNWFDKNNHQPMRFLLIHDQTANRCRLIQSPENKLN